MSLTFSSSNAKLEGDNKNKFGSHNNFGSQFCELQIQPYTHLVSNFKLGF
jgi:hypothetical protein